MASTDSSATELQDGVSSAVAAFMKALITREESTKADVRRAVQSERDAYRERDELRRERDLLLAEKMAWRSELEAARLETERWKVVAEKGEWMNNNHAETIERLQQEVREWKERYMRTDEERLRLAVRNEELVSQQLYTVQRNNNNLQEPLTPRSQGPQVASSSSVSGSGHYIQGGYASDGEALSHNHSRRASLSRPVGTSTRGHSAHSHSKKSGRGSGRHQPLSATGASVSAAPTVQPMVQGSSRAPIVQTNVLRRMRVVMDGPLVKEESVESAPLDAHKAGHIEESDSVSLGEEENDEELRQRSKGKAKASAHSSRQSSRRRWSEDKRVYDEDSASGFDSASGSDADGYYVPPKPSRSRVHEDEDEDDELNLGGEDVSNDLHDTVIVGRDGGQKVVRHPAPLRRAHTQPAKQVGSGSGRKRNSPHPGAGAAGKKIRRR